MSALTVLHKQHRILKCESHKAVATVKHHLLLDKPGKRAQNRIAAKSKDNIYKFMGKEIESAEDRTSAFNYVENLFTNDNDKFDLNAYRKVKHKLKKWISSDKATEKEVLLFKFLLEETNKRNTTFNKAVFIKSLEKAGTLSRFNDKKKAVALICDLHNERIKLNVDHSSQLNCALIDVLLKIPQHNKNELTAEEQEKILTSYYSENFPDFDVLLSIIHKDEIVHHVHIVLDGKNNKTNDYDYVQSQYEFVKSKYKLDDINNDEHSVKYPKLNSALTKEQLIKVGELLQTDFYEHINAAQSKHDFKKKEYLSEQHKSIERAKIALDTNKPIADREFNTATYLAKVNNTRRKILEMQDNEMSKNSITMSAQKEHIRLSEGKLDELSMLLGTRAYELSQALSEPLIVIASTLSQIRETISEAQLERIRSAIAIFDHEKANSAVAIPEPLNSELEEQIAPYRFNR